MLMVTPLGIPRLRQQKRLAGLGGWMEAAYDYMLGPSGSEPMQPGVAPLVPSDVPSPPQPNITAPMPNTPSGWQSTLSNAFDAIITGFWPKPTAGTTISTTPPPVIIVETPWYKTTPGMIGIAAAVLATGYVVLKK